MTGTRYWRIASFVVLFCGMVLASQAQTFNTLFDFDGSNGASVIAPLIQGIDGNLYGVTAQGGIRNGNGTAFRISPDGTLTTIHYFCAQANCVDGAGPQGPLVQGPDGSLYGTTAAGGTNPYGGIAFKITTSGKLIVLYNFCTATDCIDGSDPSALTLGRNGNFYGTTNSGGAYQSGTIFEITPSGKLTTLYSFCSQSYCSDGATPSAPLVLASNGNLYGVTTAGGPLNYGVAFELAPTGKVTTLYQFCSEITCTDGYTPYSGLIEASDGYLYGTTYYGGTGCSGGCGTIYRLSLSGQYSTVYSFCSANVCPSGLNPIGGVIEGTDGNLYGTTSVGGSIYNNCAGSGFGSPCGTLYQFTRQGTLNVLHDFCNVQQGICPDGAFPEASLFQSTNGIFYGGTDLGGNTGCTGGQACGALYSLSMGLGPFVQAQINFGKVGQVVNILGNNLTGTTSVTFNGVAAEFKVMADTYLKAQIPTGATTGTIEVTTSTGTLDSNLPFQVLR